MVIIAGEELILGTKISRVKIAKHNKLNNLWQKIFLISNSYYWNFRTKNHVIQQRGINIYTYAKGDIFDQENQYYLLIVLDFLLLQDYFTFSWQCLVKCGIYCMGTGRDKETGSCKDWNVIQAHLFKYQKPVFQVYI